MEALVEEIYVLPLFWTSQKLVWLWWGVAKATGLGSLGRGREPLGVELFHLQSVMGTLRQPGPHLYPLLLCTPLLDFMGFTLQWSSAGHQGRLHASWALPSALTPSLWSSGSLVRQKEAVAPSRHLLLRPLLASSPLFSSDTCNVGVWLFLHGLGQSFPMRTVHGHQTEGLCF